ncbi:MAG: carboxypeptidase-like regulatory domain-containing protein [Bryobacteraceae bacterium]
MTRLVLPLLVATNLFAAIDGTVVNHTTGKPQAGVNITLVKPGQGGMQTLGNTKSDASGKFVFEHDQPGGGPQLLQANYNGVNYNKLLTPNIPTSGVELAVYEATKSPAVARIAQHMLVLEPSTSEFAVNETVLIQNDSKTTYNDEQLGGFRFYLPPAANGQVKISAQGPGGMPLPRPAEKTEEKDVFKINYPIKPGETQFEISYVLVAGSPIIFHGAVVNVKGMPPAPLRLVVPSGVTVEGKDLQQLGTEPKTQATIYDVTAHKFFDVNVTGTGSLHNTNETNAGDETDAPKVTEGLPPVYAHLPWLLALALGILAVGLFSLFVSSPVRSR